MAVMLAFFIKQKKSCIVINKLNPASFQGLPHPAPGNEAGINSRVGWPPTKERLGQTNSKIKSWELHNVSSTARDYRH